MTSLNNSLRTWVNVLGVVLLVALVVPFVVYSVPGTVGADESYVVLTASMAPAIDPGDAVLVTAVDPATIQTGDVITYQRGRGDIPVTHRVVEVTRSEGELVFYTQGDANEDPDAVPVLAANVIGVVTLTIPLIGHVVTFVNSQYGFLALVVVPLGILLVTEIADFVVGMRAATRDDSTPAPDADATVVASTAGETAADDADDTDFTLTKNDLTLTSVGLAAFAVYSVYVAVGETSPVAVTVAVGSATAFLLAVGIRQFGMANSAATPQTDGGTNAVAAVPTLPSSQPALQPTASSRLIPKVHVDEEYRAHPRVRVDSLADLTELAAEARRPVVEDATDGAYVVLDGDVVYSHQVVDSPDDAATTEGAR